MALLLAWPGSAYANDPPPNIVYILADDLGWGDVQCYAPETSLIPTPNADRLAEEGIVFTDAHSGSAVCTPTRLGILTGRYSWRTPLQRGIVKASSPNLIEEGRPTVASFLQDHGYHTAALGKWHLGFEFVDPKTGLSYSSEPTRTPPVGARIPDGPLTRGFDYFQGFLHARLMPVVIENDMVIEHDASAHMLPRLTRAAGEYIRSRAREEQPFFLYLALNSPHQPLIPSPDWIGRSGLGVYADFVMQTDHVIAAVDEALEETGLWENTLVIFTSDNGCMAAPAIDEVVERGHRVSGPYRGLKSDLWEGGHRVPFIARWPGRIEPGTVSDRLICLNDLFATVADLLDQEPPPSGCEDSFSILPALLGRPEESVRPGVIHHSLSGHFAYRKGRWKLLLARGSAGWSSPTEREVPDDAPRGQLYDLVADPGETTNLYAEEREVVDNLLEELSALVRDGRSSPGPPAENDVEHIILWKTEDSEPRSGRGEKKGNRHRRGRPETGRSEELEEIE